MVRVSRIYFFFVWTLIMFCSCNNSNFHLEKCFGEKYSAEQIDIFYQSGFHNQKTIRKWRSDLRLSIEGEFTKIDSVNLDSLVLEMQPLVPLKIQRVDKEANVTFFFGKKFKGAKMLEKGMTRRHPKGESGKEISSSEICINPIFSEVQRRRTMRHEFMHALGMEHPSLDYKESSILGHWYNKTLEDGERMARTYQPIGGLDAVLVKMLYEDCIPIGLTKKEFKEQLDKLRTQ